MTRLRTAFQVLFAALLIVAFQQMAAARGMPQAVDEAVLCLGGVQVAVPVDATGAPVEPSHFCPDCIVHALVDSGRSEFGVVSTASSPAVFSIAESFVVATSRPQTLRARGPPFLV